jgi:hypothetical protein
MVEGEEMPPLDVTRENGIYEGLVHRIINDTREDARE